MVYSIDAVARLTGISAFTLRNWEKRYEFLKPKRLDNGFRAYDETHLELLRRVSALLSHGARIGDLAESIRKGKPLPEIHAPELAPEVEERAEALYAALMEFDLKRAETLHQELEKAFEPHQMLELLYPPLLARVGRDRNSGVVNTVQETFAATFIRLRLAAFLANHRSENSDDDKKVICATTSSGINEGCLMLLLTAHLRLKGWSTYYLGPNNLVEDVHAAARSIRPRIVCLSFADKHGINSSLDFLSRFECKVCIGGFGAVTYDAEESLPSHLHLYKNNGRHAAEVIEAILE